VLDFDVLIPKPGLPAAWLGYLGILATLLLLQLIDSILDAKLLLIDNT
jgi:hypothetical protein